MGAQTTYRDTTLLVFTHTGEGVREGDGRSYGGSGKTGRFRRGILPRGAECQKEARVHGSDGDLGDRPCPVRTAGCYWVGWVSFTPFAGIPPTLYPKRKVY